MWWLHWKKTSWNDIKWRMKDLSKVKIFFFNYHWHQIMLRWELQPEYKSLPARSFFILNSNSMHTFERIHSNHMSQGMLPVSLWFSQIAADWKPKHIQSNCVNKDEYSSRYFQMRKSNYVAIEINSFLASWSLNWEVWLAFVELFSTTWN